MRTGDGGAHLITFHPSGGNSSSTPFHDDEWLDFNMRQNGHVAEFTGRYDQTRADYNRTPTKPVLDGEPIYEDHPISFDAKKLGHSIAADVRRPLYWDLFSGAFGHTRRASFRLADVDARSQADQQPARAVGGGDRPGGRRANAARARAHRIAAVSHPRAGSRDHRDGQRPDERARVRLYQFVATRDAGTYAMVYAPVGRPFAVKMSVIAGPKVKAWWFNPRTGAAAALGTFANTGEQTFTPPDRGELLDWVLVLDDDSKRYSTTRRSVVAGLKSRATPSSTARSARATTPRRRTRARSRR